MVCGICGMLLLIMKVGVYGLGRFGTFWAQQLSKHLDVVGYNRSKKELKLKGVEIVSLEQLLQCDVIFLCVAISSLQEVLLSIKDGLKNGSTIIDTCSVKVYPSHLMSTILPTDISLIATHPMFGPDSGKNGVKGLPLVYHPLRCSTEVSDFWSSIFKTMELQVIQMSPEQHDQEAAYSQGVTHFVGRMLNELSLQPTQLATVGYQNLMNIVEQTCNDPLQLFYDLQRYNPYASDMHQQLKKAIDTILELLRQQEEKPMEDA
jgi:prephenate dehydrogenase